MPQIKIARVNHLLANIEACLESFERQSSFAGHTAMASHYRTLDLVRRAARPTAVLEDDAWYASLLQTLADWNMNERGAELLPLATVRASFLSLRPELAALENLRLEEIEPYTAIIPEQKLWNVLRKLRVGKQKTRLVVNTKALHHLLPNLIPPMDRTYTFWFFFDFPDIPNFQSEQKVFSEVWIQFVKMAPGFLPLLPQYLGRSLHTSLPKMIDNAIIGYRQLYG